MDVRSLNRRQLKAGYLLAVFLLFCAAFTYTFHFRIIDSLLGSETVWFVSNFKSYSDWLVGERLVVSQTKGLLVDIGSLYVRGEPYGSQAGVGQWLLTLPSALFKFGSVGNLGLTYLLNSFLNAAVFTTFVAFVLRFYSFGASLIAVVMLLQPWPTAIASSVYWMIGLKFLPALLVGILMARGTDSRNLMLISCWSSSTLAFLSGYEFATLVGFNALAVTIMFGQIRQDQFRKRLATTLWVSLGVISGFLTAVLLHIGQLWLVRGNFEDGLSVFLRRASARTGAQMSALLPKDIDDPEALFAQPLDVVKTYLNMSLFGSPNLLPLLGSITIKSLLFFLVVVTIVRLRGLKNGQSKDWNLQAAELSMWVFLLGPVGWHLLARPHSFVHTHINFALWYFPFVPLGLVIAWEYFRGALNREVFGSPQFIVGALSAILSILMLLMSLQLAR
jgi:hypothetical protein